MPTNVNCQCFKQGRCTHHAAPRKMFGHPVCIVWQPPSDARVRGCALQAPYRKPDGYPIGPPGVVRREGSHREFLAPARSALIEPDTPWPRA